MNTHTGRWTNTGICTHTYTQVHVHTEAHAYTECMHTYRHMQIDRCMPIHMYMHTAHAYTQVLAHIGTCTHTNMHT